MTKIFGVIDPLEGRPSLSCYRAEFVRWRSNLTNVTTEISQKYLTCRVLRFKST